MTVGDSMVEKMAEAIYQHRIGRPSTGGTWQTFEAEATICAAVAEEHVASLHAEIKGKWDDLVVLNDQIAVLRNLADDLEAALRHLAKAHLQRNFICTQAAIALAAHDEARLGQQ